MTDRQYIIYDPGTGRAVAFGDLSVEKEFRRACSIPTDDLEPAPVLSRQVQETAPQPVSLQADSQPKML